MNNDFMPGADPEEIKHFLHGLGLIHLNEYYIQVKQMLKRQGQSSQTMNEQIPKKLGENGIYKNNLFNNLPLLYPRKRTSFSPVITRKRGKAIKKRTPSISQVTSMTTTIITSTTIDDIESSTQKLTNTVDYDQPLDLSLRTKSTSQF